MTQKYQVKVSMKQAAIVETGIVLKQGDFGMQIEIEVLDFDATGTTPQIVFRKAMGAVESTTITVSGNKYTYTFKGTELDIPGKCFCDLKLKNSTTQRISTASFMFKVVADTLDGLAEQASSYSDTIAQIIDEFDNLKLDGRYTDDCEVEQNYIPIRLGAINPADGSIVASNVRAVSNASLLKNLRKVFAKTNFQLYIYGNDTGANHSFTAVTTSWVTEFNCNDFAYKYIVISVRKNDNSDISGLDLSDVVTGDFATDFAPYLSESEILSAVGSAGYATMQQVNQTKLDGRYTVDSETEDDYIALTLGAFNAANGTYSPSTIRAVSQVLEKRNIMKIKAKTGYLFYLYGNDAGEGNSFSTITSWTNEYNCSSINYKYIIILVQKGNSEDMSSIDLSDIITGSFGYFAPYLSESEILSAVGSAGYATMQQVNQTKLDGRYTVDSETETDYANLVHGAFNPDNGTISTGSAYNNRGACAPFAKPANLMKMKASAGYLFYIYANNSGAGSSFERITSSFVTEYDISTIEYSYLGIAFKKSDDSDISDTDLSNLLLMYNATNFAQYLSESEIRALGFENEWENKKILWLGTSIPAQGYPQIVGNIIKANVTNNAVGSSMMRIGKTTYDNSPLGDDLGITGMSHQNVLRSLSMTQQERLKLFLCWKTEDRKVYLINQGYTAEEVADVVGYSDMMSGSFPEEDTDPTTSEIPAQKPIDVWHDDGNTYKDMRKYSYGCCWNNSYGIENSLSYAGKITETIIGKLEDYASTVDWIFFDHFRNDAIDASKELFLTNPVSINDKYNRHYAIGAFNYLVKEILIRNPNAKILMIGHYDNDDLRYQIGHVWEAQQKAADYWGLALYKLWEESGIRALTQFTTTGYWDSNHEWHDSGFNGSNSEMTNIENLNENVREVNSTWYHDLSLRQKLMWDETHPISTEAKTHIAKLIAAWLKTKTAL